MIKIKKMSEKLYKKIFSLVPRLTVDILIKDYRGILLIKRKVNPETGKWQTPGGRVFFGERLEHAVKRIVKEETGLKIKIQEFLGVFEIPKKYTQTHDVTLIYLGKPIGGKVKVNFQASEIKFFKKLPRMGFGLRDFLKKYEVSRCQKN